MKDQNTVDQNENDFESNTAKYLNDILISFSEIKSGVVNRIISDNEEIVDSFLKETKDINKKNKQTSFLFNPLRFFNKYIGETQHSFLLAMLLDPNAEHGQGNRFINIFLEQIGIKFNDNDKWIVTAEKGRIDVLIKRKSPHAVIVIENKSHYAADQGNQLYRYWFQEMFLPNNEKDYRYTLDTKENYRLIYLSPHSDKNPDLNSLLKPQKGWWIEEYPKLPEQLEIKHIEVLLFNIDIIKWLNKCLEGITENHRLYEYIKQYIELWES